MPKCGIDDSLFNTARICRFRHDVDCKLAESNCRKFRNEIDVLIESINSLPSTSSCCLLGDPPGEDDEESRDAVEITLEHRFGSGTDVLFRPRHRIDSDIIMLLL